MVKKGVSEEIYSGTVRTFFSRKSAERFVQYAAEQGYRCELLEVDQLDAEGARFQVTVLPQALPDQDQFRAGG